MLVPRLWPRAAKGPLEPQDRGADLGGRRLLVLLAGLVIFGRDGKMLTYTALVVVMGTLAWWNRRLRALTASAPRAGNGRRGR